MLFIAFNLLYLVSGVTGNCDSGHGIRPDKCSIVHSKAGS